jgi:hypothetical protein
MKSLHKYSRTQGPSALNANISDDPEGAFHLVNSDLSQGWHPRFVAALFRLQERPVAKPPRRLGSTTLEQPTRQSSSSRAAIDLSLLHTHNRRPLHLFLVYSQPAAINVESLLPLHSFPSSQDRHFYRPATSFFASAPPRSHHTHRAPDEAVLHRSSIRSSLLPLHL